MNVKKYSSYEQIKDKAFPFYIARNKIAGFAKHTHEHFEFFYVVSGTSKHILEKKEETLRAGNIILMTPEVAHAFENSSPDFMICNCIFLPSLLETHKNLLADIKGFLELFYVETEKEGFKTVSLTGRADVKVRVILEDMLFEYEKKPEGYRTAIKVMLADLLVTVTRAYSKGKKGKRGRKLAEALFYIDTNYLRSLDLAQIAEKKAGVTKEYFCDIFKRITGKTFTEYVNSLRVEHAVRLLLSTSMKASEIALESGFNDISYFNRVFKEQKGISPQALRKKA
ncbi:MAG: hypothetical protein A2452_07230 [Candidatus Firestonebacteria bacterium RIFOXYC2_FULL_39_67]|nr:MAG: hypothetical protein A2536_01085 [Candidatus Firestonebacteria bacterium RIFOXYD2_FULL_39_29]OGF56733.1 MAG: hypothetical protein A2452_07230 [Candidatus Firestonebacteria bacterium RIFOXYC2_FULL_39_67]OGF57625.1 MAG: hypothetical protein A2497_06390 [Candidatus Firestonebacteria bacterium RifOxyC12_full_39_7]